MLIILLEQFNFIYLNLAPITYATVHTVQHSHNACTSARSARPMRALNYYLFEIITV